MSSTAEDNLQESLQEFYSGLNSSLPLRHYCEYYDSDTIKNVAQFESAKSFQKFQGKMSAFKNRQKKRDLEKEFHSEAEKKIEELKRKNEDSKEKSEAFLKQLRKDICKYFKSTTEAQFRLAPEMDLKRAEKLFETGKELAIKYFDSHSSYGYAGLYENQKQELGQELDKLETEMLEQQRRHLQSQSEKETNTAAEKLKQAVLDMLKQVPLKSSKRIKLKKAEDVQKYLIENGGNLMNGKHGEIYSELLRFEAEGSLPAEDIERWAAGLEMEVQSDIETPDNPMEQEAVINDDNELDFTGETIKEEAVEVEEESSTFVSPHEMYIDVKLELEGLILQRSSEKPNIVETRSHHQIQEERSEDNHGELKDVGVVSREDVHGGLLENVNVSKRMDVANAVLISQQSDGQNRFQIESSVESSSSIHGDGTGYDFQLNIDNLANRDNIIQQPSSDMMYSKENVGKFGFSFSPADTQQIGIGREMTMTGANDPVSTVADEQDAILENADLLLLSTNNRSESHVDEEADSFLNLGIKQCHQENRGDSNETFAPPPSKILRPMHIETSIEGNEALDLNDLDSRLYSEEPLLRALWYGKGVACIKKLLDDGADVNIKTVCEENAAHVVIDSLIRNERTPSSTLAVLNLLVSKGFKLVNERGGTQTPLSLAMRAESLNEVLLEWFYDHGADFSDGMVAGKATEPLLFLAIRHEQGKEIIQKILEYGGNPNAVFTWKQRSALHFAAFHANDDAIEVLLEYVDVNVRDKHDLTPLHLLFSHGKWDYEPCLEMLLENGADLGAKCKDGNVPLVAWIKRHHLFFANTFATLLKLKNSLPLTQKISSAALTAMVEEIGDFVKSWDDEASNMEQFLTFLLDEKNAKLRLMNEKLWELKTWDPIKQLVLTTDFFKQLRLRNFEWIGDITEIKAKDLGKLDLHAEFSSISVSIETVLSCLLACKNYMAFVKICELLKRFCDSTVS